ncbi:hypothetical protein [Methylobacterium oryzisoli]
MQEPDEQHCREEDPGETDRIEQAARNAALAEAEQERMTSLLLSREYGL